MRHPRMCAHSFSRSFSRSFSVWTLATVAILVLVDPFGCGSRGPSRVTKVTDTFRNKETLDPATKLTVRITIVGSGATFPAVKAGSWVPAAPTITNLAPDLWQLDFTVNVPNGSSVTAGGEFVTPQQLKGDPFYHFSNANEPIISGSAGLPGVAMLVHTVPGNGLVLEVSNAAPSALGDVVLQELEWTVSDTLLPLGDLVYGNSNLEALPWQSPGGVTLPVTLSSGGSPAVFDIPDGALQGGGAFVYLRYRTTTPSLAPEIQVEGVIQGPNSGTPVPLVSGAGLVLLVSVILAMGIRTLRVRA